MNAERAARWCTRAYPASWREHYGDEFECLLEDQWADGHVSLRSATGVIASGVLTRATHLGLRPRSDIARAQRLSGAWGTVAATVFVLFGAAIWSQLTIGWQWAPPSSTGTRGAMWVMTSSMAFFALLALVSLAGFARRWARQVIRGGDRVLVASSLALLGGATTFIVGAIHFSRHWPGTHGHPWANQGLVPGGVGAFAWSATQSITAYWAHPTALAHFPAADVAWMALSPLALGCALAGLVGVAARVSAPTTRPLWWFRAVGANMFLFLFGSLWWLVDGDAGPRNLYHKGAIDVIDVIVMSATLWWCVSSLFRRVPAEN